jgi:hypothetical protein
MIGKCIHVLLITAKPLDVALVVFGAFVTDLFLLLLFGGEHLARSQSDPVHVVVAFLGLEKFVFEVYFFTC